MNKLLMIVLLICQTQVWGRTKIPVMDYANAWQEYALKSARQQPKQTFPYQQCFEKAAKKHDLPVSLLLAMAKGESNFNTQARSSANAYGLMQIVWPGTAKYLGINSLQELKKPCINVDGGARYIKEQIKRFDGNIHLALAAYNYGPARISATRKRIPKGANWYSGYIYQHLQYVLNQNGAQNRFKPPQNYRDENQFKLLTFNQPYRASAFMQTIKLRAPEVRLDTFDRGLGRYHVVLLYGSNKELMASKKALLDVGLLL